MARRFPFVFLLIAFALANGSNAADSSSPSPPTTSNSTAKSLPSPPAPPAEKNSTESQDYSDYEVPLDLAPGGVEVVEDYVPISPTAAKEADELAQPEAELNNKANQPKSSDSSSSSSSSSYIVFIVAAGLFFL